MATQVVNLNTQMGASGANHASGVVPDPGTSAGTSKFLREDATFQNAVQSIALTMPAEFVVGGSPVMTSGTFAVTKATEIANTIWAGPATGAAAQPTFRALVAADIPASAITPAVASINTTGLSANVGSTLLFTTVTAGTYRASWYAVITQAATSTSVLANCVVQYIDEDTSISKTITIGEPASANTVGTSSNDAGSYITPQTVFYAGASTTINYSTQNYASSGATPMEYSLHLKLEYLGI